MPRMVQHWSLSKASRYSKDSKAKWQQIFPEKHNTNQQKHKPNSAYRACSSQTS
uniref:Uncharacterized protein n=1 Tax=Arundo donax TaxID=35708 RepID=A0A0A9EDP5_ARUDO